MKEKVSVWISSYITFFIVAEGFQLSLKGTSFISLMENVLFFLKKVTSYQGQQCFVFVIYLVWGRIEIL